jgi:putative PD-(D/E)XK family protein DUF4420
MPTDPWAQISRPSGAGLAARRAKAKHPFNFYWARDLDGRCLLIFEYSPAVILRDRRPRLREIRIIEPRITGDPARFILELTHSENREIFYQLCLDIIRSTESCSDEKAALATVLRRTWRWHGMLKGGRDDRLSPEAQKGLIGELRVLELAFLPQFSASDALDFWHGPEGAPKDFSAGNTAIEAKAKKGASRTYVEISSEHQLDGQALDHLFLAVTYIDEGSANMPESMTLTEHVDRITDLVEQNDAGAVGYLESRLDESGFSGEHDYSDQHWITGRTRWYRVTGEFPRIARTSLPEGVRDVGYCIDLASCDAWEVDIFTALKALSGDTK